LLELELELSLSFLPHFDVLSQSGTAGHRGLPSTGSINWAFLFHFFFWSGFPLICNFTPSRIAHSLFPSASIIDHIFCRRGRLILHLIVIHLLLLCEH
jgi:hypothetical protein